MQSESKKLSFEQYAREHGTPVEFYKERGVTYNPHTDQIEILNPRVGKSQYRPLKPSKDKYYSDPGYKRDWYFLEEAVALVEKANAPLIICNGWASVLAAQYRGFPATTIAGGEGFSLNNTYIEELKNICSYKDVFLFLDCDNTGRDATNRLYRQFKEYGFNPIAQDLDPDRNDGYDLANWLVDNPTATPQELYSLTTWINCNTEEEKAAFEAEYTRLYGKGEISPEWEAYFSSILAVYPIERIGEELFEADVILTPKGEYQFDGLGLGNLVINPDELFFQAWGTPDIKGRGVIALLQVWMFYKTEGGYKQYDKVQKQKVYEWVKKNCGLTPPEREIDKYISRIVQPTTTQSSVGTAKDIANQLLLKTDSDAGNAERFEILFGEDVRFNHTTGKWVIWDGKRWSTDRLGRIDQMVIDASRIAQKAVIDNIDDAKQRLYAIQRLTRMEDTKHRRDLLATARTMPSMACTSEDFDQNPMLLAIQNGVIDLNTCTFREIQKSDMITRLASVQYDPTATCPRWEMFLCEVFNNDKEMISYLQRAIGYTLTGSTKEHAVFLTFGTGCNGKSVALKVISKLLGDYAETVGYSVFDASSRNEQTNDIAGLKGSRFVSIEEVDEDMKLNTARLKAISGETPVKARFLYQESFTYYPEFKVWFAVNHKPVVKDTSDGTWRRLQHIPFTQNFLGRQDKDLANKLQSEISGILNWALEGLRNWHKEGLNPPSKVVNAGLNHRQENDFIGLWLEDMCVLGEAEYVTTDAAYASYTKWATENGYNYPITKTKLTQRLGDKGYPVEQKRAGSGFGPKPKTKVYVGFKVQSH